MGDPRSRVRAIEKVGEPANHSLEPDPTTMIIATGVGTAHPTLARACAREEVVGVRDGRSVVEGETVGGFERCSFSTSRIASERVAPAARA